MLSAEEENTPLDLHNSLYHTTAESNGCLFKIFPTLTKHAKLDQRKVPVFITCLILACSSAVYSSKHSSNSSCHPLSGIFVVFAVHLGSSSAISSTQNVTSSAIFPSRLCQNSWVTAPSNVPFSDYISVQLTSTYIDCLQVAITTPEGRSLWWGYPYIKSSPYR